MAEPLDGIEREQARLNDEIAALSVWPAGHVRRLQRLRTWKLAIDTELAYRRARGDM